MDPTKANVCNVSKIKVNRTTTIHLYELHLNCQLSCLLRLGLSVQLVNYQIYRVCKPALAEKTDSANVNKRLWNSAP